MYRFISVARSTMWGHRAHLNLAALLAGALAIGVAHGQSPPAPTDPTSAAPSAVKSAPAPGQASSKTQPAAGGGASATNAGKTVPAKSAGAPSRYLPGRFAGRAGVYYKAIWGIDSLSVKWAESGELIRVSWRVLDPQKAKVLNDKRVEPSLIDPKAGVSLVIPVMEKIGQLRQTQTAEAGRSYWMAFSNKGRLVKRGDRVDLVVGPFRAENLAVD